MFELIKETLNDDIKEVLHQVEANQPNTAFMFPKGPDLDHQNDGSFNLVKRETYNEEQAKPTVIPCCLYDGNGAAGKKTDIRYREQSQDGNMLRPKIGRASCRERV